MKSIDHRLEGQGYRKIPARTAGAIAALILGTAWVAPRPASAQTNLLANGGFETPPVSNGNFNIVGTGQSIGAWTVVGNDVLLVNTNYAEPANSISRFNAIEGVQSVDLTGNGNTGLSDGVSQSVATTVGQAYTLSFFVGRASGGFLYSTPSIADLSINGGSRISFTNSNATPNSVNWQQFFSTFTANTTSTNITFYNGTSVSTNNFVGLDNVQLSGPATAAAAPEPGTIPLLLVAGVPVVGILRRRKTH